MSNGKYGDLIKQARKQENQKARKPDDQILTQPENQSTSEPEEEVNLCVKVPKSLRRHWPAESKLTGITMTRVIVEALTARFGQPESRG